MGCPPSQHFDTKLAARPMSRDRSRRGGRTGAWSLEAETQQDLSTRQGAIALAVLRQHRMLCWPGPSLNRGVVAWKYH